MEYFDKPEIVRMMETTEWREFHIWADRSPLLWDPLTKYIDSLKELNEKIYIIHNIPKEVFPKDVGQIVPYPLPRWKRIFSSVSWLVKIDSKFEYLKEIIYGSFKYGSDVYIIFGIEMNTDLAKEKIFTDVIMSTANKLRYENNSINKWFKFIEKDHILMSLFADGSILYVLSTKGCIPMVDRLLCYLGIEQQNFVNAD